MSAAGRSGDLQGCAFGSRHGRGRRAACSHRFGVSTVLAFLLTGAFLSPGGLGALTAHLPQLSWLTITDPERLAKFAEWGVVFLLFIIGLELSFERLSTMRRLVFGLGGSQVLVSAALIGLVAYALGQPPVIALVIGAALCLSSTAIVIELLASQKRLSTSVGRTSFSILLFQDLAVVPILHPCSASSNRATRVRSSSAS